MYSMPWVRSAVDNVLKDCEQPYMISSSPYGQFCGFPPSKIVEEDPGRCKVLEDILSSVHQRRGEVWRIASARSNSRPLNAPQELLQSSQVRGQKTVFSYFLHFKSSAPQELLQSSQVRGHVRSAGDRTNQASQKQRCYYQWESLLKVSCKIPTPLKRKYPVRFISGGKYVKC